MFKSEEKVHAFGADSPPPPRVFVDEKEIYLGFEVYETKPQTTTTRKAANQKLRTLISKNLQTM
jgi:hypothetical protein